MAPGKADDMRAQFSAMNQAGRYGSPEEVAALVAFLASEDARYIHGAVFTIDGGFISSNPRAGGPSRESLPERSCPSLVRFRSARAPASGFSR